MLRLIYKVFASTHPPCILGWVDIGTGTPVGAVVIHNGEKKFCLLFFEFFGGFSFEDLQKNTSKMCENSVVFESCLFCVSCLAQKSVLPGGRNSGQKGQKVGRQ
jgi:hypothetical protein